jgi:hypothetical protein
VRRCDLQLSEALILLTLNASGTILRVRDLLAARISAAATSALDLLISIVYFAQECVVHRGLMA